MSRRIIVFLIVAQQPLRLSELSNALAIRLDANDYSRDRVPRLSLIQDLCGHFVTFDYSKRGSSHDPLLKLAHKSIQDFFLKDPTTLEGVPQELRKFFVELKSGHSEVGRYCLAYLSYSRYQDPLTVSATLDSITAEGHEFLNYAATFWFRHLMETNHSSELLAKVEHFVRSPAFWTCLTVQSKIAPHLFAMYLESKQGTYGIGIANARSLAIYNRINFASPVPHWLDEYEPTGSAIAFGVHSFVKEWHPILASYPSAVSQCKSEVSWTEYPYSIPSAGDRVVVFKLISKDDIGRHEDIRLQGVSFQKGRLYASILEYRETGQEWEIALRRCRVSQKKGQNHDTFTILTTHFNHAAFETHIFVGEEATGSTSWSLDLQKLNVTKRVGSGLEICTTPDHIKKIILARNKKSIRIPWIVTGRTSGRIGHEETMAYHCSQPVSYQKDDDDSGYQSTESESESESESEAECESDSNTESDSTVDDGKYSSHCLVITCQGNLPIWFAWRAALQTRLQITCATHPIEPIAVWTHVAHEVCMANLHSGSITRGILPEPIDVKLGSATAITKGRSAIPYFRR